MCSCSGKVHVRGDGRGFPKRERLRKGSQSSAAVHSIKIALFRGDGTGFPKRRAAVHKGFPQLEATVSRAYQRNATLKATVKGPEAMRR